jgi:hypothetical protein
MSGFTKVLVQSPAFSVTVMEAGGELKIITAIGASAGGGNVAGFAKVGGTIEADLEAAVLIDAGFGVAEAKYASNPAILMLLKEAQTLIDAELPKI